MENLKVRIENGVTVIQNLPNMCEALGSRPAITTVLIRVSIAKKGHYDHGNSYRGLAYRSEVQSIIIMVGSREACQQT